jgi:putative ubiquitin-RnfH superfamily antitoxin RatB of RatAB toxin-antitoxin module
VSGGPGQGGAIRATVVYARADRQWVVEVGLEPGATLAEAVRRSGLLEQCPELGAAPPALGVCHRRLAPETAVRDGDRIEIYRPLQIDPKEARRLRAGAKRAAGPDKRSGGSGT